MNEPQAGSQISERRRRLWPTAAVVVALAAALVAAGIYWGRNDRSPNQSSGDEVVPKEPVVPTGPPWFREVTAASGLNFTHRNGEEADQFTILESLGGGVALIDFDGDGLLDIFVMGGGVFDGPEKTTIKGHPCKLFRNLGKFKFTDVTKDAGLEIPWWYTQGAAVADYDRDGWPDLLVTGYGRLALFRNVPDGKGGRRFVDVTDQVGLRDDAWSTSAGWADLDGDGYPELYVCHYVDWSFANHPSCPGNALQVKRDVCGPERFKPLRHSLFRNEAGKSFRDVSAEHGFRPTGCGLGVLLADVNDDGRPDIYVANDTNNNYLYLNRGGKLEELGSIAGVAADEAGRVNGSMGVDLTDFDGSGRASLFVTNYQNELHALYRNFGKERFQHQSSAAGIAAIGQQFVGFGTAFLDVDNDGWDDLILVNGHVLRFPVSSTLKQRPVLMRNIDFRGRRFFQDVGLQGGPFFAAPNVGRGLAVGDLDNDGWPDLVISHNNRSAAVLRNEAGAASSARWLGIRLSGRDRRDVAGSTVIVETDKRKLTRFAKGGGSYLSANDQRLLFGMGQAERASKVTVKWSWGETQIWNNLESNAYWDLHEGQAAATRAAKMSVANEINLAHAAADGIQHRWRRRCISRQRSY